MIIKVKESFEAGMERLRWLASVLSERIKVEMAVVKLLWTSSDLEKKREELVRRIGERMFELRGAGDVDVFSDRKISQTLKELEGLDAELQKMKKKVSEIGEVEQ